MPPELNHVAREALREPARVDLAPPSRPAAGITQAVYPVTRNLKTELLDEILSAIEVRSMIVFTRTKHGADRLARQLGKRNYTVAPIHGNRSQSQRERALGDLKRGRIQILVATDIASRGIDVEGISHIVNYDVPHSPEDYVHRIGRTGRMDAIGDAFTLMSPEEQKDFAAIERFLGRAVPRVMLPDFDYKMRPREIADSIRSSDRKGGGGHGGGSGGRGGRGSAPAGGGRHGRSSNGRGQGGGRSSHGASSSGQSQGGAQQGQAQFGRRPKAIRGVDRRRGRL
jgi:ATP-dependent RNA helicase RhlE